MGKRLDESDIRSRIYQKFGDEYTLVEKTSAVGRTEVVVIHNKCNRRFSITLSSMLRKGGLGGCKECARKSQVEKSRYKHSDFLRNFNNSRDDFEDYVFLEKYKRSNIKIKTMHLKCGYVWDALPTNLTISKTTCPKCANRVKKTQAEFENEVLDLVGDEYSVVGKISGVNEKIEMVHNLCNHTYMVAPAKFSSGRRCPKCFGNIKKTHTQFVSEVYNLVGVEYSVLSEYKHNKHKVKIRHENCGYDWYVEPNKFLNFNTRCPKCADISRNDGNRKTQEEFARQVAIATGDEYTVIGNYTNNKAKILIRHEECRHEWCVTPDNFLRGNRCPKCRLSKGESSIVSFLDDVGVKYKRQLTFNDCADKLPLPFDIAIESKGCTPLLIEYDGKQHFTPVMHWGGEEGLRGVQRRDSIKNDYCDRNNIELLRIPYWELENIETILFNKLVEVGILKEVENIG